MPASHFALHRAWLSVLGCRRTHSRWLGRLFARVRQTGIEVFRDGSGGLAEDGSAAMAADLPRARGRGSRQSRPQRYRTASHRRGRRHFRRDRRAMGHRRSVAGQGSFDRCNQQCGDRRRRSLAREEPQHRPEPAGALLGAAHDLRPCAHLAWPKSGSRSIKASAVNLRSIQRRVRNGGSAECQGSDGEPGIEDGSEKEWAVGGRH